MLDAERATPGAAAFRELRMKVGGVVRYVKDAEFELVPLEVMKDNPDGLDLVTPSICFHVDDLEAIHDVLVGGSR
jgi:hypothetical protein